MAPGQPERIDHEYQRQGVANLFMFFEPLAGQRHLRVTDRRTRLDWAEVMRELADVWYPDAETIVVVLDNLNTHTAAPSMKPSHRRRRTAWPIVSSSITPPSTAAGSTWPKSNSVSSAGNVSTAVSLTNRPSPPKSHTGRRSATANASRLTGSLRLLTHAPS